MHYLVRLIVDGESADEALKHAESFADSLCSEDFDYYNLNGRWGEAKAIRLSSEEGEKEIEEALRLTRNAFDVAMKHARYIVEHYDNDSIYNEDFDESSLPNGLYDLSRWQFAGIGCPHHTNSCYLYGYEWGAIENDGQYTSIPDKDNLWVVPVDFHN